MTNKYMNPVRSFTKTLKRIAKSDAAMSCRVSWLERRKVCVRFDGKDWIETWDDGGIAAPLPVLKPVQLSRSHIDLFTKHYQPKEGDIVMDVGAGCGNELPFFSRAVGKNGRVIAIEASPDCVLRMEKLKKVLDLSNVTILRCAIGESEGTAKMTSEAPDSLSDRVVTEGSNVEGIAVEVMTLDAIIEKLDLPHVDYMKVNIEGAETALLKGCREQWGKIRNFCISCHDFVSPAQRTYDEVRAWFTAKGMVPQDYEPTDYVRVWRNYYVFASAK